MTEESTKIIRIVIDSSKAVDGGRAAQKALEAIERQTGTMASAMDKLQSSIVNLGGLLKAQLALQVVEAAARLVEMTKQAFEAAAGLGELAQQVGLTARELQGLQFIGVQSGAGLDDITTAATKFSVKMGEAANGSKEVIDSLTSLGVQNLDLQGKLRPSADLMAEIARKILEIEDPARRSAAMVDFFGKSGTKMTAALEDMAKGLGVASTQAQKFGAMISDDAIKRLDELADSMDRSKLRTRAFLAEGLAAVLEWIDRNQDRLKQIAVVMTGGLAGFALEPALLTKGFDKLTSYLGDLQDNVRTALDGMVAIGAGFVASFLEVFTALPRHLGRLMTDGMNAALAGLESGLNKLNAGLAGSWIGRQIGMSGDPVSLGRLQGGGASPGDVASQVNSAGVAAEADFRARYGRDYAGDRARQRGLATIARMQDEEAAARRGSGDLPANLLTGLNSKGAGTSTPKASGGETPEDKIEKLKISLTAAADAQDAMTAAAMRGDVAFQQQQAHADALQKAIDVYGGKVDATNPKVAALAGELEKLILRTKEGAAAQAFVVGTTELEKQNVILAAQNKLMNEAPDIQAREIALIKAKQEAEKGGAAITADMTEQRRKAIEQNETLKLQAEQMKQANELWTEPLRQGLRNIQTAGADAWETILETGKVSFESLGEVFLKTVRRMAAEFLALATIRPVLSLAVDVIGPNGLGILGGNSAAQLGFPVGGAGGSAGSGGGLGGILGGGMGGGGLGSIFNSGGAAGGGWFARQFSGVSNFLSTPLYGGPSAAAFEGVMPGMTGAQAQNYFSGLSGGGGIFSGAGPTIGQGIGGIASIGMGAYGLIKGGQSTAGTIGSVAQIAGGVMMMVPGLQIPGMLLSMAGGILPGLFGDGPKIPPQPALAYSSGAFTPNATGGFGYGGDSLGSGSAMTGGAHTIATNLQKAFRAAGLSTVAGRLYGGELASGTDHTLQGGQWQDRPYTQTGLINPQGELERLTYNDSSMNAQQAGEYLLAQVFKANVMRGGVSGAGEGLKAGLDKINPVTSDDLDRVVTLGTAYDKLGKAINPAKDAIDKINASFDDLKDYATQAGLSLDPINEELKKQSKRSAQDFIDSMIDPLAVSMRALEDERESALASAQYIKDHFETVFVDMDKVAVYYTNKEAALRDQFYQGGVAKLQAMIDRLTYGDLANASPTLQLSGAKAAYNSALGLARGGDAGAITNLSAYAESYLGVAQKSFASSPEYQALVEEIRAALQEQYVTLTGGATTAAGGASTAAAQTATGQQIAQLTAMVNDLVARLDKADQRNAQLVDLMQRVATNV